MKGRRRQSRNVECAAKLLAERLRCSRASARDRLIVRIRQGLTCAEAFADILEFARVVYEPSRGAPQS